MVAYSSEERVVPRKVHVDEVENKLGVIGDICPGRNRIFLLLEFVQVCSEVALEVCRMDQG
jgi:hypothetical protein